MLVKLSLTALGAIALLMYLSHIGLAMINRERMRRGEIEDIARFDRFASWWILFNLTFSSMIVIGAVFLWLDKYVTAAVVGGTPVCFLLVVIVTSLFYPKLGSKNGT